MNSDLLSLPLFLGMNKDELGQVSDVFSGTKRLVNRGTEIALAGDACNSVIIIAKGTVNCVTRSDDYSYSMEERLHAPLLIQPERIFGLYQRYSSTFVAATACEIMTIEKAKVLMLTDMSLTFRLNLLNVVTTQSQRLGRQAWHKQFESIDMRIIRFVKDHCLYPAGYKKLRIQMVDLARELGCSRLEVSEALHRLEDRELIVIRRAAIEIPMLQMLIGVVGKT